MLATAGVHRTDVAGIVSAAGKVFEARRLRAGQPWRIERTFDGRVRYLEYEIDLERYLRVWAGQERHVFAAAVLHYHVRRERAVVRAVIARRSASLFAAMAEEGQTPDLAVALADIFGGEVDFNSALQTGDTVRLIVDRLYRDGRFVGYGPVQIAELVNAGRLLVAVRYQPNGALARYYDRDGKSMKRFFLRSPLRFEPHVTSTFSAARFHPILHEVRAHLGVDYRGAGGRAGRRGCCWQGARSWLAGRRW